MSHWMVLWIFPCSVRRDQKKEYSKYLYHNVCRADDCLCQQQNLFCFHIYYEALSMNNKWQHSDMCALWNTCTHHIHSHSLKNTLTKHTKRAHKHTVKAFWCSGSLWSQILLFTVAIVICYGTKLKSWALTLTPRQLKKYQMPGAKVL